MSRINSRATPGFLEDHRLSTTSTVSPLPDSQESLILTGRDLALLKDLFESRLITLGQASEIHFNGHYPMAKKRISKLRHAKLIGAKKSRFDKLNLLLLFLTRRGFNHIRDSLALGGHEDHSFPNLERRIAVSMRTIEHEHSVNEVKAAFYRSARSLPVTISAAVTWPHLIEFNAVRPVLTGDYNFGTTTQTKDALLQPDGFFRIRNGENDHHFYLEVDRSTEKHQTLLSKAVGYRHFLLSGGHARRFGFDEPTDVPFRVLFVLRNQERRNNLFDTLLRYPQPIKGQVWASTFDRVREDPFGTHWLNPAEYHRAVKGHPQFDPLLTNDPRVYIRRPEREAHVNQHAKPLPLIPNLNQ